MGDSEGQATALAADALDERRSSPPEPGLALCLSGGGYRAMLFHLGALWRLNEAGLLRKLDRVSSVSGGSITAAVLATRWRDLRFADDGRATNFHLVADAVRAMADVTVDVAAVGWGVLLPGSISSRVADAYDEVLFDGATLQDLPDDPPRFVLNATNVQSGALWRFSKPYMGDWRVGLVRAPRVRVADAVAASSAFPPFLSPMTLPIRQPVEALPGTDLSRPPFTRRAVLSDGGVYDNLGLETAFKRYDTLLVSDGGQKLAAESDPAGDWARHSLRVIGVVDNQVRSLRKRALIDAFVDGSRKGTFWGIRTRYADYGLPDDPLGCLQRDPGPLAAEPTRLGEIPRARQERIINWGYAICDAALRRHFGTDLQTRFGVTIGPPEGFPYARGY